MGVRTSYHRTPPTWSAPNRTEGRVRSEQPTVIFAFPRMTRPASMSLGASACPDELGEARARHFLGHWRCTDGLHRRECKRSGRGRHAQRRAGDHSILDYPVSGDLTSSLERSRTLITIGNPWRALRILPSWRSWSSLAACEMAMSAGQTERMALSFSPCGCALLSVRGTTSRARRLSRRRMPTASAVRGGGVDDWKRKRLHDRPGRLCCLCESLAGLFSEEGICSEPA